MMKEELIAPCGMNCAVCSGYLAGKHQLRSKGIRMAYCAGCRPRGKLCAFLKKRCHHLLNNEVTYCYECSEFPCRNLLHLDQRYRTLYKMSFIENLEYCREHGIEKLLEREQEKWQCPTCGDTICCHNGLCFACQQEQLATKEKKYRWDE